MAVEATIAEQTWTAALGAVTEEIADCFERREPRALVREMTEAMLMELDTRNCWTLAEALGHRGPHRLQHFLSRAVVDHDRARDRITAWTAAELADPDAVLVVDETGDEKSSTDCVGAARQKSRSVGRYRTVPGRRPPHLRKPARARPDQPVPVPRRRVGRRRGTAPAHPCPRRRPVRHQTPDRRRPAHPRPRPGHTGTVAGRRRGLRRQGTAAQRPRTRLRLRPGRPYRSPWTPPSAA